LKGHHVAVGLLNRLKGADEEERAPEVRLLHFAMAKAVREPSPEANQVCFTLLAEAELWTMAVGQPPSPERLMAQFQLSGQVALEFRAGRTPDGESFLPTATTRRRLAHGGVQPGDSMVRMPFKVLASLARDCGVDALVVNPGTVPFAHIARPAMLTFADGLVPDPVAPDRVANTRLDALGPLEPLDLDALPPGLLEAATAAVSAEPEIVAASLVVRSVGRARLFVVLAVVVDGVDRRALRDRLPRRLANAVGGEENYSGVEYVAETDSRLTDPQRAVVLLSGSMPRDWGEWHAGRPVEP
jgi:SseB protein N-terminal domain